MDENTEYENYRKRLEEFPCAFNLAGADKVTMAKFRSIQHNLDSELTINENCENERIIKLNLLTWVRFRQGEQDEAVQLSNDAVDSTGRRNVASLGNRFFVMWQTGDEFEAKKCLEDLEKMKSEENYHTQFTDAQAEQAYYYSRLGGPSSLQRAIDIFSTLPKTPINYLRKFGCGLVYHRITHVNIFCSSSKPLTVQDYQRLALECLFEVADNADSRLKSLAYAQLVNLRRSYPSNLSPEDEALFRGLGVMRLCEKALEHGQDIPTVLVQCGKAIKPINIDKAIEWLKKSVEFKDNSAAYHHLGICYNRKAEKAATGNRHPQNTSEELRDHDCIGQQKAESQVTGQSHDVTRTSRDEHRRPADGSTVYHQANNAEMNVMEEYPQVDYKREHGSTGETHDQHLPWNCQYQQISGQRGYTVDEHGYLSHLPSQVKYTHGYESYYSSQLNYTHGYESYYSSQLNYTHTQMNHHPLDMSQTFGQTCGQTTYTGVHGGHWDGQTTYMDVDGGHWDSQNVQVDSASCVNDNAENYGACGSIHDETVAESMPSAYSYVDLISGPIPDSENYYIDGNGFYIDNINWEQNEATENNTFTYPIVETQTGSVQHVPDTSLQWYDDLQYIPVPGRYSTHESEGPGWNAPNLGFRPGIAGNMYSTPWNVRQTKYVQNMRGRRRNARSRGGFRESGRITSGSHCDSPEASSSFGNSRRSTDGKRQSARDIGLVRGNAQSTGRHVRNNNRNGRTSSGGRWEPKPHLKSSLRRCRSVIPLNKDDENVQEALNCFKKAIKIAKENLSAALDFGLLLKQTNQIDEALKQFNSITKNNNPSIGHRVTVISAFEQAGLCCLQLGQIRGNNDYKEMAKNKLTRAVSMAADLALIMPELQGSHKDVWVAFTTLITEIDKEQVPKNLQLQQKIKVLELAREYGYIVDVIQKLKELGQEELTNPDIIKTALDSYLKLGQPDNALGYHNLVSMNPGVNGSDWWNANPMRSLRVKVLLHAISRRLREISDSPTFLFQQLFELVFGSCFGLRDPDNDQQNDADSVVFGDVLFVFDTDESPEEESMYTAVKSARCLKRLSAWLFGLETQENMKGTGEFGDQCQIQLNEMLKYHVVIIVLGNETRDNVFNAMLERVSYNKREKAPPNQKILVIDAGLHGGEIPQYLKQFKSLKLEDIGILGQLQTAPASWSDSENISFTDIIKHVGVDAVLKLFCFMIDQTWPCP